MSEENEVIEIDSQIDDDLKGAADDTIDEVGEDGLETEVEADAGDDQEIVVTIGDEPMPDEDEQVSKAPQWVKDLRKQSREDKRRIRELEAQISKGRDDEQLQLGPRPTLADADFDEDVHAENLSKWFAQKQAVEEQKAQAQAAEQKAQEAWQARVQFYSTAKADLKVKDYDDAEAVVQEFLSPTQQGIIVSGAENPALVVYALGKNPAKAKEIAGIKDPVQYAFAIAKLEAKLKMTTRKPPAPERQVGSSGGAPSSGSVDSTLERLRAEAEKTGDLSKVIAYKNSKKRAS